MLPHKWRIHHPQTAKYLFAWSLTKVLHHPYRFLICLGFKSLWTPVSVFALKRRSLLFVTDKEPPRRVSISGGPLHAAMRCPAAVCRGCGGAACGPRAREKRGQTNTGRSLFFRLLPVLFGFAVFRFAVQAERPAQTGAGPGRIAAGPGRPGCVSRGGRSMCGGGGVVSADRHPSAGAVASCQSMRCPSTETVTTCHGMNLPLARSAAFAAASSPPQQGTSIRMTVRLATSLSRRISVSFSV